MFNRKIKLISLLCCFTCFLWLNIRWKSTPKYLSENGGNVSRLNLKHRYNKTNAESMILSSRGYLGGNVSSTVTYGHIVPPSNHKNTTIATCGGQVRPIAGLSIFPVQTCNEAYTMNVDWVIEIRDNRLGVINISQNLEDGYCKKSSFESWGVVANKKGIKTRVACDFETPSTVDEACNSYRPPEYHTFILWNPSLWVSQEAYLSNSSLIEIVDTFVVTENHKEWCKNIYTQPGSARNKKFCKLYGDPKVVVVLDPNPEYGRFLSGKGTRQLLNKHIHGLKLEMRKMVGKKGHLAVHSSQNVEETELVLKPLKREYRPGLPHFNTIKELFSLLDEYVCFRYVVLRAHEEVDLDSTSKDIDILVNDYYMFKAITGAESMYKKTMRDNNMGPNSQNIVNEKWIFNVRYVGDGYYDTAWQLHMLQHRVKSGGVWIQEPLSHAMSLIYHYNVHTPHGTNAEPTHLNTIKQKLPLLKSEKSLRARTALQTYMTAHKYYVVRPHDSDVKHHMFESLQNATFENYPLETCLNLKPFVNGTLLHYECVHVKVNKTSIGNAIVKKEPFEWTSAFEPITNDGPKLNYRPYSEYILSEASNYVNISGVPLSVGSKVSFKKGEPEKSPCSVQLMVGEFKQFDPNRNNETFFSRIGEGILDYLFDTCDRLDYPNWDLIFQSPKKRKSNAKNLAKDSTGSIVWFDNGKSIDCSNGTKSLTVARESVLLFWDGWCDFPPSFHVEGLSSFLFEQMRLPNPYISEDFMRGLQWREQVLLEYMKGCNGRNSLM